VGDCFGPPRNGRSGAPPDQAPQADAIVLLGGGLSGARPPERPGFDLGSAADRVWYAAALFKAGKASWVLV